MHLSWKTFCLSISISVSMYIGIQKCMYVCGYAPYKVYLVGGAGVDII